MSHNPRSRYFQRFESAYLVEPGTAFPIEGHGVVERGNAVCESASLSFFETACTECGKVKEKLCDAHLGATGL